MKNTHYTEKIDTGLDSLEGTAEQTQLPQIIVTCQPLIEEMLGSANLAVAKLVARKDGNGSDVLS